MNKGTMDQQLMTREESYVERRQLFKDIWETSMNMDDKEDIMPKPKVIKTLRLSEVDRCVAKKKKKQKLKNLRVVCNKLLDFCDRQEADDLFHEQAATGGKSSSQSDPIKEPKVKKKLKVKKRIKKRILTPFAPTFYTRLLTSDRKRSPVKKIKRYISLKKLHGQTFHFRRLNNKTKIILKPKKTVIDTGIAPKRSCYC